MAKPMTAIIMMFSTLDPRSAPDEGEWWLLDTSTGGTAIAHHRMFRCAVRARRVKVAIHTRSDAGIRSVLCPSHAEMPTSAMRNRVPDGVSNEGGVHSLIVSRIVSLVIRETA